MMAAVSALRAALAVLVAISITACPKPQPKGPTLDEQLAMEPPEVSRKPAGTDDRDAVRLHTIDIGQGLAQLIEFPCGVILYDTGGEVNRAYDFLPALTGYLDELFARRPELDSTIDLLAISHPHIDHTRGIAAILERYKVKAVIDNGDDNDDLGGRPQMALHKWIAAHEDTVKYFAVRRDDITSRDGLTNATIDPIAGCERAPTDPIIRALWGGTREPAQIGHNANNDSVVLRIDYGKSSMLLPGDLEIVGWAKLSRKMGEDNPIFDVDVYTLGHHGSKNATVPYLVKMLSPKVAVASAGPYSRYLRIANEFTARKFGHPNAKALAPLIDERYGVSMWRDKPAKVWVGIKGGWKLELMPVWEAWVMRRAVYTTSWDGTVVITANANGFIDVQVEIPEGRWKPERPPAVEAAK